MWTPSRLGLVPLLMIPILVSTWPGPVSADRIFYQSGLWLETSAPVQRLSLLGVLRAWEVLAETGPAHRLSPRQHPFVRLHHCLKASAHTTDALLEQVTVFSFTRPDRIYYSLSDFMAETLKDLCPN